MATSTHGSRASTFKFNETTAAPAVTDDGAAGYSIGSVWYDTTADKAYICLDTTNGAAVWKEITPGAGANYRTLVELGSDVASAASTAYQDITGLSFAVSSGVNYRFEGILLYTTSASSIGLQVGLTSPAVTHLAFRWGSFTGKATNAERFADANDDAGATTTLGSINTTTGNIATFSGVIRPSASGTVQMRFAPETATASGIVIETGSTLEWW